MVVCFVADSYGLKFFVLACICFEENYDIRDAQSSSKDLLTEANESPDFDNVLSSAWLYRSECLAKRKKYL